MAQKITIEATSTNPPIEYSIWQEGVMLYPWQESNIFTVSETGDFEARTRDDQNCSSEFIFSIQKVPDGYIGVSTAQDLRDINNDLTGSYYLMNDIDLSVYGNFIPICIADDGTDLGSFSGEFNGGGHVIKNLSCDFSVDGLSIGYPGRALFHDVTSGGLIQNLGMINPFVSGVSGNYVGTIASRLVNTSNMKNCYSEGGIVQTGGDRGGGLIGIISTGGVVVENCYSSNQVNGGGSRLGIFTGYNFGSEPNCYYNSSLGGSGISDNSIALTASQMKQEASFNNWDFTNIWQIDEGNDFPRLRKGIV